MNLWNTIKRGCTDLHAAAQFLTRLPVPALDYRPESLPRSVPYFPVVGVLAGGAAALVNMLLRPHLPVLLCALGTVLFLVLLTGCFHEDGLADAVDAFGGGWNREQVLTIMKDSRIGSYGGAALVLSLLARVLLIASLPTTALPRTLLAAHMLCRWTTLPLSYFLPPARSAQEEENVGLGTRIARLTTRSRLIGGTFFCLAAVIALLGRRSIAVILSTLFVTAVTGLYYRRRIGGVTGDCFGATNQITEILIYLCGVWIV